MLSITPRARIMRASRHKPAGIAVPKSLQDKGGHSLKRPSERMTIPLSSSVEAGEPARVTTAVTCV